MNFLFGGLYSATGWHLFLAILTVFWVQKVGAGHILWIPTIASFAFCLPIFARYLAREVGPRAAWFMIALNLFLSLFVLSQVHVASGILFSCPDSTSNAPCVSKKWADGIYFSIVTFTTLGYGDYQPIGYGRYFAAAQALAGYLVLGLTVGSVLHWAVDRRE